MPHPNHCPQCGKEDCKWVRGKFCDGDLENQVQREITRAIAAEKARPRGKNKNRPQTFRLFSYFVHRKDNHYETAHSVDFLADSRGDALDAAVRWIADRKKNVPDYFKTLGCIKIYTVALGYIDVTGSSTGVTSMPFFEWKYDWGLSLEQGIEVAKDKMK